MFITVQLSEAAKNLCMAIMQGESGVVWKIPRPTKRTQLVVNGSDYITDQDSQETRREELEKVGILSVKSLHPTDGSTEYRTESALAKAVQ